MPSFQHFQSQANKSKSPSQDLSLSGVLEYAESARKMNFEALCRVQPLVKTYRDKIRQTSKAMIDAEAALEGEAEIPAGYAAGLSAVKEGFTAHLGSLDEWMNVLAQKREADSERAIAQVRQSGQQLEMSLQGLSGLK